MIRSVFLVCVFFVCALAVWGQADANKGQIAGTVYDPNQAVVPNAKVTIKNTATGALRDVTSNDSGQFRAVLLDPGAYDVTVESSGFAPAVFTNVVLNVGSAVDLSVNLKLGTTTETVEVAATLLNTDIPAPTVVVNATAIENLPINGRRFTDFAALTPTVQINPQRGSISFAGQRGINGNVMVDGADYNNPFFGGTRGGERSNFVPTIPQVSIQEFEAITTGYAAEYGRSTGGVLNAVSKSGSNDLHAEGFYQIRPRGAGEENPLIPTIRATPNVTVGETREQLQQFGGGAGGAIMKDKLFWFAAAERQLSDLPRQVFFASIYGLAPTPQTQAAINYYQSLQGPISSTNDATATLGRLDYQMTSGSRITARFNFSDANANNAITTGAPLPVVDTRALSGTGAEKDRIYTGVAQYTAIITPTIANDLRFSGTYEARPRTSNSAVPNVNDAIGNFGARNFLPTVENDTRYQINDGLSIVHGSHTFKFGGDYSYLTTFQYFGFNQFGSFSFGTTNINTILKDLTVAPGQNLFDDVNVRYQLNIGNLLANFNMHQIAFYAQDQWKMTPHFQINYGLRWEGQVNPQPVANNTSVVQAIQAVTFPLNHKFDPTQTQDNLNQWMPRFGFTYSPFKNSNNTVIRGHAGIFYAATPMLLYSTGTNNFRTPPGDLSLFYSTTNPSQTVYQVFKAAGYDLNKYSLGNLPILTPTQATNAIAAVTGATPNPYLQASFTATANDFANPRAVQAGFGVDQQITSGWVVSGQFNYINTVHLERNRDYNLPLPTLRASDGRYIYNRAARPLPQYGQITLRESSARSMYRGGTFSTRYSASKRLQFGAQYTLAQAFDDDSNERDATCCRYDSSANFKAEYGYSSYDIRSQFSGYAVYNLPYGVRLSGSVIASTGQPIDPLAGSNVNGDGKSQSTSGDRAFKAVGVEFPRNYFRNVGWRTVNLRVMKDFRMAEKYTLQLSAEMFNLFNFNNIIVGPADVNNVNTIYGLGINTDGSIAPPRTDASGPTFMRLKLPNRLYDANNSQIGTPFQAQFGVRFMF
ncbi:MAG TPA: carboxypeptidase regulatory-like domain-containing protein [Bryobacteraceae bacterium]|nr:carboxypeptidase regulatory-like domain-containing protein [Bryobacteraceae bacterium]